MKETWRRAKCQVDCHEVNCQEKNDVSKANSKWYRVQLEKHLLDKILVKSGVYHARRKKLFWRTMYSVNRDFAQLGM